MKVFGCLGRLLVPKRQDCIRGKACIEVQVSGEKEFFANIVVDAVNQLDPESLDLSLLGTKKVQGGGLRDSFLVDGVAFKKTFSYAGFEMQKKKYSSPRILALNIELELKSEKDNAEVPTRSSPQLSRRRDFTCKTVVTAVVELPRAPMRLAVRTYGCLASPDVLFQETQRLCSVSMERTAQAEAAVLCGLDHFELLDAAVITRQICCAGQADRPSAVPVDCGCRVEHHLRQACKVRRIRGPDRAVQASHRGPGHPVLCRPRYLLRRKGESSSL